MLFDGIRIGKMVLENRLVMPPLETNLANDDGSVSQRTLDHYERRARGGPGLIVVECTSVDPVHFHRNQLNISDDRFIDGLSRVAEVIKRHGVRAAIQIQHPGRQIVLPSVQSVAPSPLACRAIPRVPRELTIDEIEELVERFAEAVRRARDAGFDAVQFHGAHGYLIAQFMSAWSNKRADRYGGDVYGRATFPLEIIARTREKVGTDYPLIFRFSGDEYVPEGRGIDESKVVARLVEKAGIDAISVSAGTYDSGEWTSQPMLMPRGCLVPLAAEIKSAVGVPVVTVGRIHSPRLAEEILQQGKADLIAMGRPLFADPDLPMKAREGREREIRHCISCNTCMRSLSDGGPVICLMNPELGREGVPEVKAPQPRRVLVVNGGPAGIEAARVAALRGHQVKLWDERPSLGGRWSWLLKPYIASRLKLLAEIGVTVELGKTITPQAVARENPEVVIAGRGLKPEIPLIPGMDEIEPVQADDILVEKKEVTGRVVVLGGGSTGFEVTNMLVQRGRQVCIVEEGDSLGVGLEPMTGTVLRRRLVDRGVVFQRRARIIRIAGMTLVFTDEQGTEQQIPFDHLVLALDWQPEGSLVDSLRGGDYRLIPVGPYQQPVSYVRAFLEGTAVGREI
ncbi:MAG TPA: FAD-dependent oxidoreductase [Dehalococcoidales bacterium]|nr:FAD-dependent oxidoreductase [Dehalococcoidales bacterium]